MKRDGVTATVVDPLELKRLKDDCARLRAACRWRAGSILCLLVASLALAVVARSQLWHATKLDRDLRDGRRSALRSSRALAAMAWSHERILSATEQTPLLGTKSWGRRFGVTNYIPRSPKYGKFNDGLTATLTKAEPSARIVAVDPALIPYGSSGGIEGLGWHPAEECGGALKGLRLAPPGAAQDGTTSSREPVRFPNGLPARVKPG